MGVFKLHIGAIGAGGGSYEEEGILYREKNTRSYLRGGAFKQ